MVLSGVLAALPVVLLCALEMGVVLGEVGDPMKKFVYVSGSNNKIVSVSKKSLSKEYPTTLLKLMGVPEEEDKKSNKKLVKV